MMKFTDLNIDCLEIVLEYLELIDLLNVADSTKRLNKVAELVFVREHGKKDVNFGGTQVSQNRSFRISPFTIDIEDLKTGLQLLRCVGGAVSEININASSDFYDPPEIDAKICYYISKYCAKHLNFLGIYYSSYLFKHFDGPFPNLTHFCFVTCNDGFNEEFRLNELFPNMKHLSCFIEGEDYSFYEFNIKHFPHLNKLSILDSCNSAQPIRKYALIQLLQLNPQLKELWICRILPSPNDWDTSSIWHAVDSLQNIETLSFSLKSSTIFDNRANIIHMKSVKTFDANLHIDYTNIFDFKHANTFELPTRILPFSFEKLEKFRVSFCEGAFVKISIINQFYDFIDNHPSITDLTIRSGIVRFDWLKLAKSLPLLVKIKILGYKFSDDEAIELMAKFSMLKEFVFELQGDYYSFRTLLGKQWQVTYDTKKNRVHLKRKI